jgi:putative oxidoreductase
MMVGVVFLAHGYQKVFMWGFAGVTGAFAKMGIPMPGVMGPLVALVELLGGLALFTGLLTRWAAFALAVNMTVAVLGVHLKNGFFLPAGFEYALTLLVANVALVLAGPGVCALDNLIGKRPGERPNP